MAFLKLFWGFIFLIDLYINGVDILPDVFGYILIYLGLRQLTELNINFKVAKKIALSLVFLSIFNVFMSNAMLDYSFFITSIAILNLIYVIINLIMVYRIISGIAVLSKKSNNFNLETSAINIWKLFFGFNVLVIFSIILPLNFLSWLVSFFSVLIYLLVLYLISEARNKISLQKKRRVYYTL